VGRIQRAVLTLFAGRPEAGKSTAVRWFAAQWSRGELDGCWKDAPQKIAYIASEEALEYVVKPGLQVAGADMVNFTFPEVKMNGEAVALMSDTDEHELTEQLLAEGVTVVIVDPIMATIRSKVDIYRNNDLREALAPWVRIARRINGTVIGVVHLNKGTSGDVVASVNGSSAFGEVARCVFGFTKDPECEPERVMSQVKNSCGPCDLSLTYEIAAEVFTADTKRRGLIPVFGITGESDTTVGEILATAGGKRRLSPNMQHVLDLVNSRHETHADIVVNKGLAKTRNAASKMLERLCKRDYIDNPAFGSYCPKVTKCQTS
jgi:predicted ATP-dependent serine protease